MKRTILVLTTALMLIGSVGLVSADLRQPSLNLNSTEWSLPTAQEHESTAQKLEKKIAQLQDEVEELNQKISRYEKKPYLDPKRFRRDGLKILRGSTVKKMSTLQDQVAWHRAEAVRLAVRGQSRQENGYERAPVFNGQMSGPGLKGTIGKRQGEAENHSRTRSS